MTEHVGDAELLRETPLLNYSAKSLALLPVERGWGDLPKARRIGAIYDFVRDEIRFGYNASDAISASEVLRDGYGQCNTKATLLMALLRGSGIPCRLHGFTIHKELQAGAVPSLLFGLVPDEILHSWVEVPLNGRWLNLEGFILDKSYLEQVQRLFADRKSFCGFGVSTSALACPPIEFNGGDTYIQHEGIARDLGSFPTPDAFFLEHGENLGGWKGLFFSIVVRRLMNANVERIRSGTATPSEAAMLRPHEHRTPPAAQQTGLDSFAGLSEQLWIASNALAFAILDAFPATPGHVLVVPRRVIANWFDTTPAERTAIFELVDQVRERLDRELQPDGYNIGINLGEAGGQTIPHAHVHLIPRYLGDVAEPRGGVRRVIPHRADYFELAGLSSNAGAPP